MLHLRQISYSSISITDTGQLSLASVAALSYSGATSAYASATPSLSLIHIFPIQLLVYLSHRKAMLRCLCLIHYDPQFLVIVFCSIQYILSSFCLLYDSLDIICYFL